MIELHGVAKSFGSVAALHPTDLIFESGRTTALIGPSGCGKSTLLNLIIGLVEPTSGQVVIDNQAVRPENLLEVRRKTGYVIQDGGLFPHLTAEQNVTLLLNTMGESNTSSKISELADLVRIPNDLLRRYPAELSGGQRQRVGLMRALMRRPSLLLLDEPLAALDPMVRADLQTDLKSIFAELKTTVILVTHDMGEAAYLADKIVLLRDGRVVQQGTLADFQQRPNESFVTEFLNAQRSLVAL